MLLDLELALRDLRSIGSISIVVHGRVVV
jgi:hypothetical protein